jgi:GDPmannose 4,6-dehydratase
LYGLVQEVPQTEKTPFYPRSPYGVAKLYAYWITVNYREAYGIYACNGILFNHESPVRGETFVSRKITRGVAQIIYGLRDKLYIGNLNAKRDWGHAKDYVKAMYLMMQLDKPQDFVIATGITTRVKDLIILAFKNAGVDIEFKGAGKDEKGYISGIHKSYPESELSEKSIGRCVVEVDPRYFRPAEVDLLIGDASKAREILGWTPEYDLGMMVEEMVSHDLRLMEREKTLKDMGHESKRYYE